MTYKPQAQPIRLNMRIKLQKLLSSTHYTAPLRAILVVRRVTSKLTVRDENDEIILICRRILPRSIDKLLCQPCGGNGEFPMLHKLRILDIMETTKQAALLSISSQKFRILCPQFWKSPVRLDP